MEIWVEVHPPSRFGGTEHLLKQLWLQFDKVMCKPSFPLKIIVIFTIVAMQLANFHSLQYSE